MIHNLKDASFDGHENNNRGFQGNPFSKSSQDSKYLWVLDKDGMKIVRENTPLPQNQRWGIPCHTNLTGGGEAIAAGEVWFFEGDTVRINAVSLYYGPISDYEYKKVIEAWEILGYKVMAVPLGER